MKYWALENAAFRYGEFMMPSEWNADPAPYWRASFGERRITHAADLVGEEVVERAVAEAHADFRKSREITLRQWDMLINGTLEEKRQLADELRQKPSVRLMDLQEEEARQEEERNRWVQHHQAARDAYRESSRRCEALRGEVERLQEELAALERSIGLP